MSRKSTMPPKREEAGSRKQEAGEKEQPFELDFGIGKIKLGGLFENLGKLVDFAEKLKEMQGEMKKEGEFTIPGKKDIKGVYGFSIRTGLGKDGSTKPIIEPFGNIKKTPKGTVVEESREPLVDVFDEKDGINIVAEMPGVEEAEISYEIKGDVLLLLAGKKYSKEILLKSQVEPEPIGKSYKNGVFELKLKKKLEARG